VMNEGIRMKDNNERHSKFGSVLRSLRLSNKLTQDEMAKVLGLSKQVISNYENFARSPNIETLIMISDHFGVSVDYLVGRSDHDDFRVRSGDCDEWGWFLCEFDSRWAAIRFWWLQVCSMFRLYVVKMKIPEKINPSDWVGILGSIGEDEESGD